jgi:hypothetical protein
MKEAGRGRDQTFIADDQAAAMAEPRDGALDEPPPPVAPQPAAVLGRRPLTVGAGGHAGLDAPAGQPGPQGLAAIAPIGKQARRPCAGASGLAWASNRDRGGRPFAERDCRRGRRLQVCSQRRTRALDLVGSRAGARTVGEGFPSGLFRLPVGFTVPPWPRFQLPPRQTERADFPHSAYLLASPRGL